MRLISALGVMIWLTAGCAARPDHSPSLLPRPIEHPAARDAPAPTTPVVADPVLLDAIATDRASLDRLARAFVSLAASAERAARAAHGAAVGSERWVVAQTEIGNAESHRGEVGTLLDRVEQTAGARSAAGLPDEPALNALIEAITAESDGETATTARLAAMLPEA